MDISKYLVFDTENDPVTGKCYAIGVRSGDDYRKFTDPYLATKYIIERPEKYIKAFNLTYDAFNLLGFNIFNTDLFFIKHRMAKMGIGKKVFLDCYNHWDISLAEAGHLIGIHKKEHDDYKEKVSDNYLMTDCEISYKFIEKMLDIYRTNGINYKLTLAGTALTKLLELGIKPFISDFDDWYYNGYFGGRTEVFKKEAEAFSYDINSMYPACMLNKFPYPLEVIKGADISADGMTTCTVKSNMDIPILPYRDENRSVYFPNGIFTGTWCNNELRYFIERGGTVIKVISGIHFKRSDYVFKGFVNTWYDKRIKSKTSWEKYYWKKFLNATYGKFGEKAVSQQIIHYSDIKKLDAGFTPVYNGEYLIITKGAERKPYANVIWSAYTTAYARIALHTGLYNAGIDNIIYCDTDSIYTKKPLDEKLIDNSKLGYFKFEGRGKMVIYAPKDYDFIQDEISYNKRLEDWRLKYKGKLKSEAALFDKPKRTFKKRKGVPRRAKEINPGQFSFDKPIKLFEGLKHGLTPNAWINITKTNSREVKNKIREGNNYLPKIIQ